MYRFVSAETSFAIWENGLDSATGKNELNPDNMSAAELVDGLVEHFNRSNPRITQADWARFFSISPPLLSAYKRAESDGGYRRMPDALAETIRFLLKIPDTEFDKVKMEILQYESAKRWMKIGETIADIKQSAALNSAVAGAAAAAGVSAALMASIFPPVLVAVVGAVAVSKIYRAKKKSQKKN